MLFKYWWQWRQSCLKEVAGSGISSSTGALQLVYQHTVATSCKNTNDTVMNLSMFNKHVNTLSITFTISSVQSTKWHITSRTLVKTRPDWNTQSIVKSHRHFKVIQKRNRWYIPGIPQLNSSETRMSGNTSNSPEGNDNSRWMNDYVPSKRFSTLSTTWQTLDPLA